MKKPLYSSQSITQYLLGELPEREAERLDELSLTDDHFADELKAAESELIDAFITGELSGDKLEQFKSYYCSTPLRREKLRFAQAFHTFAEKRNHARVEPTTREKPDDLRPGSKGQGWVSSFIGRLISNRAMRWGAATAVLVLTVAGSWMIFENKNLREQLSQTQTDSAAHGIREQDLHKQVETLRSNAADIEQELARARAERDRLSEELATQQTPESRDEQPPAVSREPSAPASTSIATFVLTPQMRAIGPVPVFEFPAKTGYVTLVLDLEANDYPNYVVNLIDPSNNSRVKHTGAIKAEAKGDTWSLKISLPTSLLSPHTYVARVSGERVNGAREIVSDYTFTVVK